MKQEHISRRTFLSRLAAGAATATLATACHEAKSHPVVAAATDGTSEDAVPVDAMTYRTNPRTGAKVSLLGYGCMRWPSVSRNDRTIDQEQVNHLVDYAIAHGVNYFDTAPIYHGGLSERITGIALKRQSRESFQIATKLSNYDQRTWGFRESKEMYLNSFKELQVDYIDYYLLHGVGRSVEQFNTRFVDNGMLDFLLEERAAGRIRNLGFSFHGTKEAFDYALAQHERYHWDFVQIQMNYIDWRYGGRNNLTAEYLYEELHRRNIPVVIMEPLLGGRLSKVSDHISACFKEREPSQSVASWAFRFAGQPEGVLTVLSGMTYMEHLQDNIRTYSPLQALSADDLVFLDRMAQLFQNYPTIPCTGCDYCMPCPYGIDIPGVFQLYNRCVNEGNVPASAEDPNYRKARRAFLVSYDRAVESIRQADHCIGCRQCVSKCPQRIRIPAQMQRVDALVEQLRSQTTDR